MFRVLEGGYPSILDPKHPNLSAFWTFDNISGATVYDDSRNSFDGTMVNTPTIAAGWKGNSMETNGTNEYMSAPIACCSSHNVGAVSMWFRPTSFLTSGYLCLADVNTAAYFHLVGYHNATGDPGVWFYNNRGVTAPDQLQMGGGGALTNDTWSHIVCQGDGTDWFGYVNGTQASMTVLAGTAGHSTRWFSNTPGADNFRIASLGRSSAAYQAQNCDQIRIFDRILTQDEITTLANE